MTSIISNQRERTRFLKFTVVGIIGAAVDFGMMNLLVSLFSAPLVVAGTISFLVAVMSNFLWNRYWTYPDSRSKRLFRQLLEFFIVSIIGMAIRIPTLIILEPIIFSILNFLPTQLPASTQLFITNNLTLAVAVGIVMFWNFFINRYWTYNDVD